MSNAVPRGMPLLSGPLPGPDSGGEACRKCNKEFNLIFARSRKCNHCGYLYCQSCTDYHALMPRQGDGRSQVGYDPAAVCAFCIENLNITAAGKGQLRGCTLAKLKKYAKDYNIDVNGVIEKDDLIDRLIAARGRNGCLPSNKEQHYRLYSVPQRPSEPPRGIFSRARGAMNSGSSAQQHQQPPQPPQYQPRARTASHPTTFPRPDLDPGYQQTHTPSSQQYSYNEQPNNIPPQENRSRASPYPPADQGYRTYNPHGPESRPQPRYNAPPGAPPQPQYNPPPGPPPPTQTPLPSANLNVPPTRPRSASAPRRPASGPSTRATSPPPPIPTLDELLAMPEDAVQKLSISTLKAVLFRNHVNTGMVVEKQELVAKVRTLIADERLEREAAARRQEEEDRELTEALAQSRREHEEALAQQEVPSPDATSGEGQGEDAPAPAGPAGSATPAQPAEPKPAAPKMTPKAQAMAAHLERTGLCVICQDEEANIAIVDCGHLAMCRPCSDLIMNSTRECPLCRTRIITEARLLRIFKA
ncbi:hypothetical protein PHLGIDRAFT_31371 [Phlebiopsis gigantea 11061_1 CR5-6]|uniref:RING-type domain-containing protein n=1 Tax=Phlebiopsis gigantea (strain 11061_1 CR5-6) TaxID=745531 RepID=A0A0C3S6Y7_PHLG1|nr:hypothetical protein PHLGIDRAFT_31371 [Phlebiopsis gigantea 11061_1 CR5-6]